MTKSNTAQYPYTNPADSISGKPQPSSADFTQPTSTELTQLNQSVWITDYAWVSGLAGALLILVCGWWYYETDALSKGVYLLGMQLTSSYDQGVLAAIVFVSSVMVVIELLRLYLRDRQGFFVTSPLIKEKKYQDFFSSCVIAYLQNLLLLWLVTILYSAAPITSAWGMVMSVVWSGYLWLGLPYVVFTRALKHDLTADATDYPNLINKILWSFISLLPMYDHKRPAFELNEKKTVLGLMVKLFFCPLMTQFIFNQFPILVSNLGYTFHFLPEKLASGTYDHKTFNQDLYHFVTAVVFTIDVGLAWCGYMLSTRWLDNQTKSAEPTLLGWAVCLINYPPFQLIGLYFAIPSEEQILGYSNPWLVSIFISLSLACIVIYMSATVFFGVRFSNLTNRGIIRKGPYAWVRHPAYASKNIFWWCAAFPYVWLNIGTNGLMLSCVFTVGLALMTWIYYMRAITEERHLSADPYYLAYCQDVKYRFLPGVI